MSRHQHHARLLWCAAVDATWRRVEHEGRRCLMGKCIHCNRKITLGLDGTPGPTTTLEHIVPRTHGGTHAPENLALACARCNGQKGVRLDGRPLGDPTLQQVMETLRTRREARLRAPPPDWDLPNQPPDTLAEPDDAPEPPDDPPRRGRRRRRR